MFLSATEAHYIYLESIKNNDNDNQDFGNISAYKIAKDNYVKISKKLSELLSSSYRRFNMFAVIIGIIITTLVNLLDFFFHVCTYVRMHIS